ncbi:unnamed protein product [Paramecium primaurelia]|uniref:Uncharacterized protein n=1 Tax=Paramecium primaurelia TaxID=5886 RepID=A0A8S1LKS1_PARPR|nr:unnamed protein product [Paramecium primaurelia]
MKIFLYRVVLIRLKNFWLNRMNGIINKQLQIILVGPINQVEMNKKIKLYFVNMMD